MDQVRVSSPAPILCVLHLNAVDKIPPVFSIRWSDDSSPWRNVNPVFQICRVHRGLHSELDRPVCGGDGLPHPGGEHVAIPPKDVSSLIIINGCVKITHTDSYLFFSIPQKHLQSFCFLIFLFFCASCALFVRFNVPETKNRTTLEIAKEFEKMHGKSKTSCRDQNTNGKLSGVKVNETQF